MTINTEDYPKGYINSQDLERQYELVDVEDFYQRKYNQVGHLKNVLAKLDDMALHDNVLFLKRTRKDYLVMKKLRRRYVILIFKECINQN